MEDNINLPCALKSLSVKNFQGIKELSIDDLPLHARWIFLTGENGFGKTSILRAIAKGLVGNEPFVSVAIHDGEIKVEAVIKGEQFKTHRNFSVHTSYTPDFPLTTYGISRFQLTASNQTVSERSMQKTYSLFNDDGLLLNIEQELITSYAYNPPRFDALRKVFLYIIPNLNDIKINNDNGNPKLEYIEKDDNGNTFEGISLNEFAAGYRSILTVIGDMMIRLSNGKENLNDLSGIVLIDEIDAHLHPKYQYELPKLLSEVFPKIQFIASTHSPIPILGLPENNKPVVLTVERSSERGITVDRKDDDFDIRKLNPQSLLTSPIFGFHTLFARGAKAEDIIASDEFQDVEKIEKIKKRLQELREKGSIK
jgi:predicted ATP-binding protein involved in virulence